jgi:hypothetical protein
MRVACCVPGCAKRPRVTLTCETPYGDAAPRGFCRDCARMARMTGAFRESEPKADRNTFSRLAAVLLFVLAFAALAWCGVLRC